MTEPKPLREEVVRWMADENIKKIRAAVEWIEQEAKRRGVLIPVVESSTPVSVVYIAEGWRKLIHEAFGAVMKK